jgi:hypothetical protein
MLEKNLQKGGFGFCPRMDPSASSAICKSEWVASNGSRNTENKTRKSDTKLLLEKEGKTA